jgi:hypothetical protein
MLNRRFTVSACYWGRTRAARRYAALLRCRSILRDDTPIGGGDGVGHVRSEPGPALKPLK